MCGSYLCRISYGVIYQVKNCDDDHLSDQHVDLRYRDQICLYNCPNMRVESYPQLRTLSVNNCPVFDMSLIRTAAPRLEQLEIHNNESTFNIERFPCLIKLVLHNCFGVRRITNNPRLSTVYLNRCPNVDTLYNNNITDYIRPAYTYPLSLQEDLMYRIIYNWSIVRPQIGDDYYSAKTPGIIVDSLRDGLLRARLRIIAKQVYEFVNTAVLCNLISEYVV